MKIRFIFCLFVVLLNNCVPENGLNSITESELKQHAHYLASDELKGRIINKEGIQKAEVYIADAFKEYGLEFLPGYTNYFINFKLFKYGFDPDNSILLLSKENNNFEGKPEIDFKPFFFSGLGEIESEIVFAGYGITAPEYEYDDYENLDVNGKIVFLLRHEPYNNDPEGKFSGTKVSNYSRFTTKL